MKERSRSKINQYNKKGRRNAVLFFADCSISLVNFTGADLTSVDFTRAKILESDFSEASLNGADCSYAEMTYCNFTDADLAGCIFSESNLSNSDLTGSYNINACRFDNDTIWPEPDLMPDDFDAVYKDDLSAMKDEEDYAQNSDY